MEIIYDIVRTDSQIRDILALQQLNLKKNISKSQQLEQGFLTVDHSFETLQKMAATVPQIIALGDGKLVGYALSMTPELQSAVPELVAMFELFSNIQYQSRPINSYNYYAMGQICVAAEARGMGVFDGLYTKHKAVFKDSFDFIITEVSIYNSRSMRAHERVGFKSIHQYFDPSNNDTWAVVLWDFNQNNKK